MRGSRPSLPRDLRGRSLRTEPGAPRWRGLAGVLAVLASLGIATGRAPLAAQSIEPRGYSNAPVGVSFLLVGFAMTEGGLAFDTAVPLTDPDLETTSGVLAYARVLDLGGRSAKLDVIVPYTFLEGTALFRGEPIERQISGFADPAFRLTYHFFGAPALTVEEFARYRQDLIVGGSVQVTVPLGQYDETRLVNIGMNRWTVKAELGLSKAVQAWTFETKAAATLFTDNDDFFGGQTREQEPIYSGSGHAIYDFPRGRWASLDVTYFTGGRTTLGGERMRNLQQNWRLGGTLALPVSRRNSIKLYASSGVSARTGNSYDLLGIAWQHRW